MRADQVAQLAVALCADGAAGVSGQIFAARGNEVFLFNQRAVLTHREALVEHLYAGGDGAFVPHR